MSLDTHGIGLVSFSPGSGYTPLKIDSPANSVRVPLKNEVSNFHCRTP